MAIKHRRPRHPRTEVKRKKQKKHYKVINWKEYNQALVNRGRISLWISDDAKERWQDDDRPTSRGRPRRFSNSAIETCLTLRQLLRLPLRQAEGCIDDLFTHTGVTLPVPDHTTLCNRAHTLGISVRIHPRTQEDIHVVVDASGVKVYGEGEWKVRVHGWSKYRSWKKVHIAVREDTGEILAGEVTGNAVADEMMLSPLLSGIPEKITRVSADGAYDRKRCYEVLAERQTEAAIPPRRGSRIRKHGNRTGPPLPRDQNIRRIPTVGRTRWKREMRYHRRSIAENVLFRMKTLFGERVCARTDSRARTELLLRLKILNRMRDFGMPKSVAVT